MGPSNYAYPFFSSSKKALERAGRTGDPQYRVALRAEETGGLFKVQKRANSTGSFPGLPMELVNVMYIICRKQNWHLPTIQ